MSITKLPKDSIAISEKLWQCRYWKEMTVPVAGVHSGPGDKPGKLERILSGLSGKLLLKNNKYIQKHTLSINEQ
jgi:hypothetical protein